MKITIFQSAQGDCLLLTSQQEKRILCDGGMSTSYTSHVSPTMNQLHRDGKALDVVYVSHIDRDHIGGVLRLMDAAVRWKVFEFQRDVRNNRRVREPRELRPPVVKEIWHNALETTTDGSVAPVLTRQALLLRAMGDDESLEMAHDLEDLALGESDALKLNRRIGDKQLDIPLNPHANGKLLMVRSGRRANRNTISVGDLTCTLIGPFKKELDELRDEWIEWARENRDELQRIARRASETEDRLTNSELHPVVGSLALQGEMLRDFFRIDLRRRRRNARRSGRGKTLGRRGEVSAPNLASLMFLVEEGDKSLLLTGDGHHQDIMDGLKANSRLDRYDQLHVDAMKIPHHGSEHNVNREFFRKITADNYIFCGNGSHTNPELDVVKALLDARIGSNSRRTRNPAVRDRPFTLWFNSGSSVDGLSSKNSSHMKKLEDLVAQRGRNSRPNFTAHFVSGSQSLLELDL